MAMYNSIFRPALTLIRVQRPATKTVTAICKHLESQTFLNFYRNKHESPEPATSHSEKWVLSQIDTQTLPSGMASPIKLWYFDLKGRAECTRLLLALTGHKFEDIRFSEQDWPKFKPDSPYGQAPFLEINGEKHGQSMAIMQFLARENGLYGRSNMEAFTIDKVLHLIQDIIIRAQTVKYEIDQGRKKRLQKEIEEFIPQVFTHLEEILKRNGTGFVVGNQLSLGDLAIYDLCNSYVNKFSPPLDKYRYIVAVLENVSQNERIKFYLKSRPDTEA